MIYDISLLRLVAVEPRSLKCRKSRPDPGYDLAVRFLVVTALLVVFAPPATAGSGDWLDRSLSGWNQASAPLPHAPEPKGDPPTDARCASVLRRPETPTERAVVAAGWSLFGTAHVAGVTNVVLGEASVDGMCRPWDYQGFVFVKGRFAGTLSPALMDSRADGALSEVRLRSPTDIEVVFLRYVDADPLCCPSRLSTARYRIERRGQGPAVIPVSVQTKPTSN